MYNSVTDLDLDHNLYNTEGLAFGFLTKRDPIHQYYLTKKGVNLFIPAGAEIGDVVHSLVSQDNGEDGSVELDEIVALASATSIEDWGHFDLRPARQAEWSFMTHVGRHG